MCPIEITFNASKIVTEHAVTEIVNNQMGKN